MSLRFDYQVRRWFDVNISFSREERDSSFALFNYEENVLSAGFTLSL